MKVERSGRPSKAAALGVAGFGILLFAGLALLMFLVPKEPKLYQLSLGWLFVTLAAIMIPIQLMDLASRQHLLTDCSLIYKHGVLSRFEVEIPYAHMQAVSVRQGLLQRLFGCGDVWVTAQGVGSGTGILTSAADANAIRIRSIPDWTEVSQLLRGHLRTQQQDVGRVSAATYAHSQS